MDALTLLKEDHDKVKKTRLGRDNDCEKGTRRENCRVLRRDPTSAKRDANPNFTSDPQISFGLNDSARSLAWMNYGSSCAAILTAGRLKIWA